MFAYRASQDSYRPLPPVSPVLWSLADILRRCPTDREGSRFNIFSTRLHFHDFPDLSSNPYCLAINDLNYSVSNALFKESNDQAANIR